MADAAYEQIASALKASPILTAVLATAAVSVAWYVRSIIPRCLKSMDADMYHSRTINDYSSWKAFGTGGTPPTWS